VVQTGALLVRRRGVRRPAGLPPVPRPPAGTHWPAGTTARTAAGISPCPGGRSRITGRACHRPGGDAVALRGRQSGHPSLGVLGTLRGDLLGTDHQFGRDAAPGEQRWVRVIGQAVGQWVVQGTGADRARPGTAVGDPGHGHDVLTARRAVHFSRSGASKVMSDGGGEVRFQNVYMLRR